MRSKMPTCFKIVGTLLTLFTLLTLSATIVLAQSYPTKPVRIIVPYPPGGTTDVVGRLVASHLSERLGQQVFVDNKGGGGGIIGTEAAAKAAPDGYTLFIPSGAFAIQPALQPLPYDPLKAFAPIARAVSGPIVLIVNETVPANSVKELIALAKQKPGQLIFVTSGIGGNPHLGIELFKMMAGIDIKIVHFKGGGPAMVDLLGGHSHAAINSIPQALPNIKSGKFRVLGTSGEERSAFLPNVPTIAEAGVPGYEVVQWFGVSAPAGTPAPIIDRLSKEIKSFLALEPVKKQFMDAGAEVGYQGPADFARFIEKDIARWKLVVEKANIKLE
jgi:tripartite-type tricarboxylate transporter receptor subunit TctC